MFGVILVRIFSHSDWIRRDTPYLSEKFTQWKMYAIGYFWTFFFLFFNFISFKISVFQVKKPRLYIFLKIWFTLPPSPKTEIKKRKKTQIILKSQANSFPQYITRNISRKQFRKHNQHCKGLFFKINLYFVTSTWTSTYKKINSLLINSFHKVLPSLEIQKRLI